MNYNKATIVGRVAHTPELKKLPNGTSVTSMSVATNHVYYNDKKEKVELTDWHSVIAYGKTAETLAQYVKGGQEMLFEGRMMTRSWLADGEKTKRYKTDIMVDRFEFGTESKARAERESQATPEGTQAPVANETPEDYKNTGSPYPEDTINPEDIPF